MIVCMSTLNELKQVPVSAGQAMERHQAENSALHVEAGQLRQRIGTTEGKLQAALSERDRISADAESLRRQVTEAVSEAAGNRADAENLRRRSDEDRRTLTELRAKLDKRSRRNSTATGNNVLL